MDDDLDLLRDPDGDGTPKGRPWGLLAVALAAVLVAVAGLVWVAGSLTDGDTDIQPAAASPSATTAAPPTTPAAAATTTTAEPLPSLSTPAATATTPPPAPAPPLSTVSPTPRATPTPRPTLPPLPPKPPGVRVPDVTGLRVQTATLTLRASGFRVVVPGGTVVPIPDQRRVRAQTPAGGTLAAKGATVTLVLDSS